MRGTQASCKLFKCTTKNAWKCDKAVKRSRSRFKHSIIANADRADRGWELREDAPLEKFRIYRIGVVPERNGNATGKFHSRTISAGTFESMGKSSSKYGLIIRPMALHCGMDPLAITNTVNTLHKFETLKKWLPHLRNKYSYIVYRQIYS